MTYAVTVTPRPDDRVLEALLGDELALFHLDTRRLHLLNGSAAAIWEQLRDVGTIGELLVRLGDAHGVSPIEIRGDVEQTVARLRADGLLGLGRSVATRPRSAVGRGSWSEVDVPGSGSFAALDARVGFVCRDEEIGAEISRVLEPLADEALPHIAVHIEQVDDTDTWRVRVGDEAPVVVGSRLSAVLRAVGVVNDLAVASVPDALVLHAGAVAVDGRGVLLPGHANHGKSTLTTALVARGAGYLTDEAAAIVPGLEIRPFAKSIALDPGSFPLFPELAPADDLDGLARAVACREWHIDPARVGTVSGPVPVAAVICPHWRAGAATRVSELSPVEALHLLLGDAFDFSVGGQPVFERLVELVQTVPVVRLSYGDTAAALAAVDQVLAG